MNAQVLRFREIKHLGYEDFCKNRQEVNGKPSVNYGQQGYTKKGYECHHIREDVESNLCNESKIKEFPEYQRPENLVYLTPAEHLWAHLLINSEVLLKDTTSEKCEDLSKGGIVAILWAHHKGITKELLIEMIAEYCNRISSQMSLDSTTSFEAFEKFCEFTGLKDEQTLKNIKKKLITNICLDHNKQAYIDTLSVLKKDSSVIACICTCGGKTPFALQYMYDNIVPGKKFLLVTPSTQIYDQWDKDVKENDEKYGTHLRDLYEVVTIQTLSRDGNWLGYNVNEYCGIIIDEVHHIHEGATCWNQPIKYFMDKGLKVVGVTATTKDSQTKDEDVIFGGRVVEGLDIVTGIQDGILWPYNYISSLYSDGANSLGEKYNILNGQLDLFLKEHTVSGTIIKYETQLNRKGQKKGIVFVAGTRNIPENKKSEKLAQFNRAVELVKEAYPNAKFYILSSHQSTKENCDNKNAFKNNTTDDCFLVTFGMANEGAHFEGVNTLIMFRTTRSEIVFHQQLGRIMRLKSRCLEDPQLTVFDFTNNALTLLDQADKDEEDEPKKEIAKPRKPKTPRPEEYLEGKDVIVACEASNILEYLIAIESIKNQKRENKFFTNVFEGLNINDTTINNFFTEDVYDIWKDIEVTSKGTTVIKYRPKDEQQEQPEETNPESTITILEESTVDNSKNKNKTVALPSDKIKMNKLELFIYLSKLTFDRLSTYELINLNSQFEILDIEGVLEVCIESGLSYEKFISFINNESSRRYWEIRYNNIKEDLSFLLK